MIYKLSIRLRMKWNGWRTWLMMCVSYRIHSLQIQNISRNKVGSLNILILQLKLPKRRRDVFSAMRKITICQNVAHFQI
ncbi:hypothetical protein JTB14_022652 [Gonioctena quinquepunctata]|nr:hypothetical protein JTB14_022652 [Gonioctena quinquepunctata]